MARYDKTRKAETRDRIVAAASERFRRDGIDGVGVATLMGDVGLTHGGFYAHFESKEALVREAAAQALAGDADQLAARYGKADKGLRTLISTYLSRAHRDRPAKGCAIAALAADFARRPRDTRMLVGDKIQGLIDYIAGALPAGSATDRVALATGLLSLLAGCVQVARITPNRAQSDAILDHGRAMALRMAGLEETPEDSATSSPKTLSP